MAQEPEIEGNTPGIAHAGKRKWGYDAAQVDAFLERAHSLYESDGARLTQRDIQNVSFDLRKGGYVIAQVDATLARLERAVVDKQTTWEISQHGRVAWKAQTEELYREIAGHAQRESRTRFRPGQAKRTSYDRKQVDRLIDQVVRKTGAQLGVGGAASDDVKDLVDVNSTTVANVIFTQRKGKRGYDERQVDYYLNYCVQLLSHLESYERVADYVGGDRQGSESSAHGTAQPASSSSASDGSTDAGTPYAAVAPLFSNETRHEPEPASPAGDDVPQSFAPAVRAGSAEDRATFDALQRREQEIFNQDAPSGHAYAPTPTPGAPALPAPSTADEPTFSDAPVAGTPDHFHGNRSNDDLSYSGSSREGSSSDDMSRTAVFQPVGNPQTAPRTDAQTVSRQESSTLPQSSSWVSRSQPAQSDTHPSAQPSSRFAAGLSGSVNPGVTADQAPVDSSLAALAHMAEASRETPRESPLSFEPHRPSVQNPAVSDSSSAPVSHDLNPGAHRAAPETSPAPTPETRPAVGEETQSMPPFFDVKRPSGSDASSSDSHSSAFPQAQSPASSAAYAQSDGDDLFGGLFPQTEKSISMDIPDLSFPILKSPSRGHKPDGDGDGDERDATGTDSDDGGKR
ncbi:MAG: DivIVA domain-containing protein [Bifidobacterium sp.]|jgi:DivIVA domain-containing protein|nr:DivIVA domain-containing protein [Bifidobacterium sp.]MCI1865433.1 DivIVA domain-containing protein [Bifidobacterium sp.]